MAAEWNIKLPAIHRRFDSFDGTRRYLIRLADLLGLDLEEAALIKIARNAKRYPVRISKGNAVKYTRRKVLEV